MLIIGVTALDRATAYELPTRVAGHVRGNWTEADE